MEYKTPKDDSAPAIKRFAKWLGLKKYQIEVTFGVYMFTPAEKSVFWSIVFLFTSLTMLATILYLPQHIVFISNRAWFYVNGHASDHVTSAASGGTKEAVAEASLSTLASLATAATAKAEL